MPLLRLRGPKTPSGRRASRRARLVLRIDSGRPRIVTVHRHDIEGIKLHLAIMLARVQRVEIGNTVDAQHHGLTVDHELPMPVLQRGLDDPGIAAGPVMATARDQAHPVPIALQAQPVAVIFHFMEPIGAARDVGGLGREAEIEGAGHGKGSKQKRKLQVSRIGAVCNRVTNAVVLQIFLSGPPLLRQDC